jgi:sugar/nucleoside kinase (ribokinase family)
MSILVVGSVAYDSVKTPFGNVDRALGGSATYFASAASFFAPVRLVAVVGSDFDASELSFLHARNVDTSGLQVEPGETFRWSGSYGTEMADATTHSTLLNVFQNFRPQIPDAYRDSDYLFLANIDPELQLSVLDQVERPKLVVCDTMNFWISGKLDALKRLIERVDVFVLNETEARELAGESNPIRAARKILTMGPTRVVVKLGEYGAMLLGDGEIYRLPAFPVESVCDPTGAGDTFAGGFLGHLAETGDLSLEGMHRGLLTGAVAASFTVEKFSVARLQEIDRSDIDDRCRQLEKVAGWAWNGSGAKLR